MTKEQYFTAHPTWPWPGDEYFLDKGWQGTIAMNMVEYDAEDNTFGLRGSSFVYEAPALNAMEWTSEDPPPQPTDCVYPEDIAALYIDAANVLGVVQSLVDNIATLLGGNTLSSEVKGKVAKDKNYF